MSGGKSLKHEVTPQQRRKLKAKMAAVFKENLKELQPELQKILIDDLVTAFQNRVDVLIRAQTKKSGQWNPDEKIWLRGLGNEALQTRNVYRHS